MTCRIKHPFFIIFFHYLRDHKVETCFDTIVRVMLNILRKNTRNNILFGGMRVCERDQRLNASIQRESRYSQIRDYLMTCICQCDD